jgi:hypothetical protein
MFGKDESELVKAVMHCLNWARRQVKAGMENPGSQDVEKLKWAKDVEEGIGFLLFNLGKFQDDVIERGEGCGICAFNIDSDMERLEGLSDPEQSGVVKVA